MSNKEYKKYKLITTSSYLKYIKYIEIQIIGKIYKDLVFNDYNYYTNCNNLKAFQVLQSI